MSAQAKESVRLEAGTPVKAVLLKELTSGGTPEGEPVPLMLSEDVKDSKGRILLAKGSPLLAKVTWSRSEGTLGSLLNQPARLKIRFDSTKAIDGTNVELSAAKDKLEEYELNRENTGVPASPELEKLPGKDEMLKSLRDLYVQGDGSLDTDEARKKLGELAKQLQLSATSKLSQENRLGEVSDLVKQLRRGVTVTNLATGGAPALVDAALELAGVVGQVGSRLGRTLGGRNIRAYVGTPVTAYVSKTVEIQVG